MVKRWPGCVLLLAAFSCLVALAAPGWSQTSEDVEALSAQRDRLFDSGRYADAITIAERILAIRERQQGPEHPEVSSALNNLAVTYQKQGRFAEAEAAYLRSLKIREKALGPSHAWVALSLNNLADLYRELGRHDEAEPPFRRSLSINERVHGPDHPSTALTLSNLALLFVAQGRFVEAEALYQRALAIQSKALGPHDPATADTLNNLGGLYREQGRYAEAEPLIKRALDIKEKALGPDHPSLAFVLDSLAAQYRLQGRFDEAESLYTRSLVLREKALGRDHPNLTIVLNNLAVNYVDQGRYAEAEQFHLRVIRITELTLGAEHPQLASSFNNLALLYLALGRNSEAEPLIERSLAIREKVLGPEHPQLAGSLGSLAGLYKAQGRLGEALSLYRRTLSIDERVLGPNHPSVATTLNNMAWVALAQRDLQAAAEHWRASTAVTQRRVERGLPVSQEGSARGEASLSRWRFSGLIKATHRLAMEGLTDRLRAAEEMFETAQWASTSEAAASLAQMAARSATGSALLSARVRERQDLLAEWQAKDKQLVAARTEPTAKRDAQIEKALGDRLVAIDARLADIDTGLAKDFPDYAALSRPKPISIAEARASLREDEALVLFLDTVEFQPLPEETFIWVVTKTQVRWVRSDLGTVALTRDAAALRCGLDATAWWAAGSPCGRLTGVTFTAADHDAGRPLPFDAARAHALYKGLFGEVEDLLNGKHLLIVPSGALTTLPFQVLPKAIPQNPRSGPEAREVARFGAELTDVNDQDRARLGLPAGLGSRVVRPFDDGAAMAAGFKPGDIVLSIGGREVYGYRDAIASIQSHPPRAVVTFEYVREGARYKTEVPLGAITITEWRALMLGQEHAASIDWLVRDHSITVLPSVASLAALRRVAKPSAAPKPMIGFGNPLLFGDQGDPNDRRQAELARTQSGCAATARGRTAALRSRSAAPVPQVAGLADLAHVRAQTPLPETADELCAVARSVGADVDELRIGARATESEIKHLSANGALAGFRIVHFATHGLLAGQLTGTSEPGLILSPPAIATPEDDGYLSASEIAALKLDADWVILSACNTAGGAGSGEAAEALSGLARVFFYAGARALLVSHWEVDSDAAVKLITTAMEALAQGPKLARAEAVRRAMLNVMGDTSRPASWLPAWHPAVWAPFVVVGEGGAAQ